MPAGFTEAFSKRMDSLCALEVREAKSGDLVSPGKVLIAPGDLHLKVVRSGAQYLVETQGGPPVRHHRPSVEVLFESGAKHLGANAMGVVLTGMGNDGADGLKSMHRAGAFTVAQDEATSVVFGMPREAINAGGVDEVLGLGQVAQRMVDFARGQVRRKQSA
jgi:two-component system chemotaxis response regulator CheB